MRTQLYKKFHEKYEIDVIKTQLHYFFLMGVSLYVLYNMEVSLDKFKSLVKTSVSEREFDQQEMYNQIVEQMKEYDGVGVELQRTDMDLPKYHYEDNDED